MSPRRLNLSIHGVSAEILCGQEKILDDLERDFSYFSRPTPDGSALVRLEIKPELPPSAHLPGWPILRWRKARIVQSGGLRRVDYEGKALLEYDLADESGVLYCAEASLRHELAYLTILSRVGDQLDRRRLHRVHALGFTYRGRGGILLLPSGGGKSRLALELLKLSDFGLLADDIPLLNGDGSSLSAFPLRLGLRGEDWRGIPERHLRVFQRRRFEDKRLVDLDYFREKVLSTAPLNWILLGEPSRGERKNSPPRVIVCSRLRASAALLLPLVLGVGTPQILELMLPAPPGSGGTRRLVRNALSRIRAAWGAVSRSRCARFELGDDPRASAKALETALRTNLHV